MFTQRNSRFLFVGVVAILVSTTSFAEISKKEKKEGFGSLFNGKNLKGWMGDTKGYSVEDGTIVCKPGGNLYTEKQFSNFVLRFEFKFTPGANNGLGIRMADGAHAAFDAMELQILENTADKYKELEAWQYHGSIYGVVAAKRGALNPVGEWNTEEVVADGHRIKVIVNGKVIVDADIKEASANGTIDGKEHPGLLRPKGHIAFVGHGDVLWFRNIRIKELP